MTGDINIRKNGRAGRITLTRPQALNAMKWDMCLAIEAALDAWRDDDDVALVVIDAEGDRAFCSGGDIADMYRTASAGDYAFGRRFWADEYRLNAKIFNFPKPYVAFMQGFIMGGGVGISCHGSHRIVGETSQIAMPECSIGLVPDVGGSLLLARGPGRLGEYLGTTGTRMQAGDAIYAGFADYFVAESDWPPLIAELEEQGEHSAVDRAAQTSPESTLKTNQNAIDRNFAGETIGDILRSLNQDTSAFASNAAKMIRRQSPLSAAATVELIHRVRGRDTIEAALELEFRFVSRAAEHGDFVEGIRAAIIDKDRNPNWRYETIDDVSGAQVSKMLQPLGPDTLKL